jgi:23S rRNA (guanosine2251-2'-O)-methyltransferase
MQKKSQRTTTDPTVILVKGRHEVRALLESDHPVSRVYVAGSAREKSGCDWIDAAAKQRRVPVETLTPADFQQRVGTDAQGVAASIQAFRYTPEADFLAAAAGWEKGIIVALDHLEDPRNLGAIIRTAEIGGVRGVLLPKNRAAEVTEWAIRTSQGAAFFLPVVRVTNLAESLRRLKETGFWVYGLSEGASGAYYSVDYPGKTILTAGGEDQGLGRLVQTVCDELVSIPMFGKTPSLNVSTSLGIVLFEVLRQQAQGEAGKSGD